MNALLEEAPDCQPKRGARSPQRGLSRAPPLNRRGNCLPASLTVALLVVPKRVRVGTSSGWPGPQTQGLCPLLPPPPARLPGPLGRGERGAEPGPEPAESVEGVSGREEDPALAPQSFGGRWFCDVPCVVTGCAYNHRRAGMRPGMAAIDMIIVSKLKLANRALVFFMDAIRPLAPLRSSDFSHGRARDDVDRPGVAGSPGCAHGSVSRVGSSGQLSQKVTGRGGFCLTSGHVLCLGRVGLGGEEVTEGG